MLIEAVHSLGSIPGSLLSGLRPEVRLDHQLHTWGSPDRHLHFGRDPELPQQDTLDFSHLEAWSLNLNAAVWDPDSLSSFWFELAIAGLLRSAVVVAAGQDHEGGALQPVDEAMLVIDPP